ncbi:MAG: FecR family protein [Burkholderiales bacterium]
MTGIAVRYLCFLFILFYTCSTVSAANAPGNAAVIDHVEGAVGVISSSGVKKELRQGSSLEQGDTIITGSSGELHASMADGGYIAIRPNTVLKIDQYRAEGDENDGSVFSLVKGTFRSITGWIGRLNPNGYRVVTPAATIGIRGTDHEPLFVPQDEDGVEGKSYGLYEKVNEGETFIESPYGRTDVRTGFAAFAPGKRGLKPMLLKSVPAFFRATRNEFRVEQVHRIVKERIEQGLIKRGKLKPGQSLKDLPKKLQKSLEQRRRADRLERAIPRQHRPEHERGQSDARHRQP